MSAGGEAPVAVVTDSAASLPSGMADALGVAIVPMSPSIGGEVYPDGPVDPGELLGRWSDLAVTTSAPSPGAYVAALDALAGRPAVVVTVSRRMSASYGSAVNAARYIRDSRTSDVAIVDSRTAAGGQGLVVSAAAAPVAAAWAGRSLGVRPVLELSGGVAHPRRPAANMRRAMDRFVAACREEASPGALLHAAVLHSGAEEAAPKLRSLVMRVAPDADVFGAAFSPVMVAHTGP